MDVQLLKHLGNIDQIAGIRESRLTSGRGEGIAIAEFYNAAGLRFTVLPDRGMDIYDFSYNGQNLSFQSKNGLVSPQACTPQKGEFSHNWPGGMLVTCGLDNVGSYNEDAGVYPTHGRYSSLPAKFFGAVAKWEGDNYLLRAEGEVHQTQMYNRHLSLHRTIETGLYDKKIILHDVITNYEDHDESFMLLYHFNFGYPLLQQNSWVKTSGKVIRALSPLATDKKKMLPPIDGREEELYLISDFGEYAAGVLYNEELELGAYVAFDTKSLPNMLEWKNMKSHDYVLALEPCNTWGHNRSQALRQGEIAVLPPYTKVETHLELGVLEGLKEIREFIRNL